MGNGEKPITKDQIKMIHTLINTIGISEADYRKTLRINFNMESSALLTFEQAAGFIDALKEKAVEEGVWTMYASAEKFEDLGYRIGMATPAQLRKIEAMWQDISTAKGPDGRKASLRTFLFHRFHVSDLRFIGHDQVTGILNALKRMQGAPDAKRVKGPQRHVAG
jgi:hypothetical protein